MHVHFTSSHIFIKDAFHSVLVMKPPLPLITINWDSKEEKEEYLKNMTKVRHKLRELFSSSTINVIQNYTWMLFWGKSYWNKHCMSAKSPWSFLFGICLFCLEDFCFSFSIFISLLFYLRQFFSLWYGIREILWWKVSSYIIMMKKSA